ncbi:MAG: ATP-dependent 6-phosphofructokinase [Candidatus Eisenbacteria bacterium]|nr:ATP-dependent 6-phosphofructokinase [Candidatus Eisenbacteria bacterium]
MRVGMLTGGGDCPGLNAVIRAVVRRTLEKYGGSVIGFRYGWAGMISGNAIELGLDEVSGILPRGGTILGTSRTNPYKTDGGVDGIVRRFKKESLDALVAVGGEDTLGVASRLHEEESLPIIGVPKTIDNDIVGTDFTFGFDTAVSIAAEAIDRLHTTAESHNRVVVVEVMGRHTGWIAVKAGIAGGADLIIIPEISISLAEICEVIKKRHERGKNFSIVVVAEGAKYPEDAPNQVEGGLVTVEQTTDSFGHVRLGGIGNKLARAIELETGYETRVSVLGYVQRGGTPTAFDRVLGTRFGVLAADLAHQGHFGKMTSLSGDKVIPVALSHASEGVKRVDSELFEVARTFFG